MAKALAQAAHSLRPGKKTSLALGAIACLAIYAGWSRMRSPHHQRRYADHATERRTPINLFSIGDYPRRRQIDRSGAHPLFERRQSAYDTY